MKRKEVIVWLTVNESSESHATEASGVWQLV